MGANENKRSGRALQSEVAKNWNGKNTGTLGGEDVEHPIFSIECKHRNRRTELQTFLEQAERHCPPDKTALVVFHQKGQRHAQDLVVLRRKEFEELFGSLIWGEE